MPQNSLEDGTVKKWKRKLVSAAEFMKHAFYYYDKTERNRIKLLLPLSVPPFLFFLRQLLTTRPLNIKKTDTQVSIP